MVSLAQINATRAGDRRDQLETAIQDRLGDLTSEKYRENNARVLRLFAEWLRTEQEISEVEAINPQHLRSFARVLSTTLKNEESAIEKANTVRLYYDYVSAFLGWAVRDQYLDRNPARTETATEPLPAAASEPDRQFWSPRERKAICATTDRVIDEALGNDPDTRTRLRVFRNRALVYALGYSGCRGAEIAAIRGDTKRNGLRWKDTDLDNGILVVYGKSREWEEAPLFEPAIAPLRRWGQIFEPPADEWPVFPTLHLPSLYNALPESVDSSPDTIWEELREHDIRPPSITVGGVRRILAGLCEDSEYKFAEKLKPHGARRGLGDELYQEQAELAQDALRHKNIKTTHEAYSEERTRQIKKRGDQIID